MFNPEYAKKVIGTLMGAAIVVPSIAMGFYMIYQVVTNLGN